MEKTNNSEKRPQRGARSSAPWPSGLSLADRAGALWACPNNLTWGQCEALVAWRYFYGRHWRAELNSAWQRHNYPGVEARHVVALATLRNHSDFGPNWLAKFRWAR
jgi:hypothetical protein